MSQNNSYVITLSSIRNGDLINELSLKMAELVGVVRETGKPGSILVELKARPGMLRGNSNAVIIQDKTTLKLPEAEKVESLFFATESNTLQRTDPNQPELTLKSVDGGLPIEQAQLKRVVEG